MRRNFGNRVAKTLVWVMLTLMGSLAQAQNVRWDWTASTTTGVGQMLPVLALPGAAISFYTGCTTLPCATPAVTYQSASGASCPSNAQVVWQAAVGTGCHATADSEGNFGGWFAPGDYQYTITVNGTTAGPYDFAVGSGGGTPIMNLQHNSSPTGILQSLYNLCDNGSCGPALDSGMQQVYAKTGTNNGSWVLETASTATSIQQLPTNLPSTGQYVILYPQQGTTTNCGAGMTCTFGTGQGAWMQQQRTGVTANAFLTLSVTSLTGSGVSDANVTSVWNCATGYAMGYGDQQIPNTGLDNTQKSYRTYCSEVATGPGYNYASASWTSHTDCSAGCGNPGDTSSFNYAQPFLVVYYSGAPVTTDFLSFAPPFNVQNGTVGLQTAWPEVIDTGTANAYVSAAPWVTNLIPGQAVQLFVNNSNTGASTFTFNGVSGAIVKGNGVTLSANDMIAGTTAYLSWNANGTWQLGDPLTGSGGGVTSVSNSDGSLTISPTTGAVVGSINYAHAGTWTALETFNAGISASALTLSGITGSTQCLHVNSSGAVSGTGSDCGAGGGGVTQIIAGTNVTISPAGGTGAVTINASGSGSSQPTPFAYTFYVSAGTTYAINNQTQAVAYSGTDAAVIINDVLGATAATGATLYFKPGTYNFNSCTLETVTYTTLCYAVGIPATNSGTNYPQFKFIGESTMSGSQNSPATSGVIFNVTAAAVTAAGTNTLAAFWMRPSTVQNSYFSGSLWWNDHLEFEDFAINFPDNTHANEVAIDALEASYLGLKDVQAGFVTAPTALGASNTIAFITPATPSDGSRLVNSYASPGWDTGFQINTEHSYLEATVSFENTTGYVYGGQRNRNNSPIYHNSQMVGIQCYDDVNCLSSTDANVASGSQLDIVGLDLEYINTGVWAYSTGFTTGSNVGGLLSWTNTLTNVGRGSLTTPFPAGSGKNYAVISPTANATLGETAINDQNAGSNVNAITVLCPNIATGSTCSIPLGTSIGNWNNIYASFHYSGAGSSSNSFSIQFNGSTDPQLNLGQTSELSGGTSAMLAQTGDTYGETSVTLENRAGANGAIFQQYNGSGIDLFDLGFRVHSGLGYNLRLEKRSSSYINGLDTNGEFQFADTVDAGCTTTACIFGAIGNGGFTLAVPLGFTLKSTAAITGAVPVKVDTANANQVVATTTTDTGAGVVVGVCNNSPSSGANCAVVTSGAASLTLGTGTCAIGNFVIVDTTTNGDVKCTATYTAGTVIGVAMAAQSTVGSKFNVMVGLR